MKLIILLFICIYIYCIYFTLKMAFYYKKNRNFSINLKDCTTKILVIIPVHNEEANIRKTILSIKNSIYPSHLLNLIILNDRCTDLTIKIAQEEDVTIFENLKNNEKTKGGILKTFCIQHKNIINKYDYISILDADTFVSPDFFYFADKEFKKGKEIVQGKINVITFLPKKITCFMSIFQSIINIYMNYESRRQRPVLICGKGMVISPKVFKQIMWNGNILIEDVDFSFKALLSGYHIHYCNEMNVDINQPCTFVQMWFQQRRWISGQKQIIKKYHKLIINSKLRGIVKTFLLIGYLNIGIFFLLIILLLKIKLFFFFIISFYTVFIIITFIICKTDNTLKNLNITGILSFPLILFYWHIISVISLNFPEKKWKHYSK